MVGVFAAPCVGPPVVALLAVVGAKGDPWFGFTSFFTLALGLGAPYLVLGTFSNLLQTLPRSGDWMVWVKKVFGVILRRARRCSTRCSRWRRSWSAWVPPVALILGGVYLGFFEKSARPARRLPLAQAARPAALAMLAGVVIVATTPRRGHRLRALHRRGARAGARRAARR